MDSQTNLFMVGDREFESKVLKSDTPIIVDFSAAWCPPCRAIAPVYDKLAREYEGKLTFAKMDVDEHPITARRLGIQGFPTFVIFKSGKVIGRLVAPPPTRLKNSIDGILVENGVV